jgi:hypothetical protein
MSVSSKKNRESFPNLAGERCCDNPRTGSTYKKSDWMWAPDGDGQIIL